jgi:hypothetical protein
MEGVMKKRQIFIWAAVLLSLNVFAGERANFSGVWILNTEKSTLDEMGTQFIPVQLTIVQSDSDLTVSKLFRSDFADDMEFEDYVTLDGKECHSEVMNSPRVMTASWTEGGDSLKIAVTMQFNGDSEMTMNETWSAGETLNVKHHSSSEWGERNVVMVFDKKTEEAIQP